MAILKNQKIQHHQSFTLIELLIVIAIIGILATIGLSSLNGVKEKARDAQRMADIRYIYQSLVLFKDNIGDYPHLCNADTSDRSSCGYVFDWTDCGSGPTAMDCWDDSRSFTPAAPGQYFLPALEDSKIVSKMPVDPINNTVNGNVYSYFYFYDNSGCKCNIDDTALCISNGGNPDFAKRAYLIISNYESPHNSHGDDSCELFDSTFPNGYYIKLP